MMNNISYQDIKIGDKISWSRLNLKKCQLVTYEGAVIATGDRFIVKLDDGSIRTVNSSSMSIYRHNIRKLNDSDT